MVKSDKQGTQICVYETGVSFRGNSWIIKSSGFKINSSRVRENLNK